jgi:hypothetical protein
MKTIQLSILLLFLMSIQVTQAQRFGGDKPGIQWKQVNAQVARVIFPKGLDTMALRVSGILQQLHTATLSTIGQKENKINIVLHPYTIIANGYVALGPFRSEFYVTPTQNSFDLGSMPWTDLLAIHEYRHVQQYNNFNRGISKAFRILFGQDGQALANALSIPNWFFEGDAVFQETLVSQQGRGRIPFFFNDYRSVWKANKNYSYMKLRNGSLRDFTPDHYRLGYMLVAYGREKYGPDIWQKITSDAAAYIGLFYPFQKAVKHYSGITFTELTKNAFDYFKKQTAEQNSNTQIYNKTHFIADQEFPVFIDDETLLYVNSAYNKRPVFVLKNNHGERRIRVRDQSLDNQFSYKKGKIVYASYRPDIRWAWNDYNEIQLLDITSGLQKTITRKSKYFSPSLDENAQRIVAVEVIPGQKAVLHILDAENGQLIKTFPNPDNLIYTYPIFIAADSIISSVRNSDGAMALQLIQISTGNAQYLTPFGFRILGNPVCYHDTIYFTASNKKEDKLFAIDLASKKIVESNINPDGIGTYQPAINNGTLAFTSFTAVGYRIQKLIPKSVQWKDVSMSDWQAPIENFGIDFQKNNGYALLNRVTGSSNPIKSYSKSTGLFNFHSLLPYFLDPDYTLSLVGNNVLNTMQSELFLSYNRNEQYKQVGFNGTYGGWFPYVNVGTSYIFDRRDFQPNGSAINWNEGQINAGLSIPLNLSKGRSITGLTMGADYVLKTLSYKGLYKDSFQNNKLAYINSYVSFSHQVQQARQHIYPHLAQTLYFNYRNAIQQVNANQLLLTGNFYWPGLFANHSFVVNLAMQNRDTLNQYRFSNSFPFSRGYQAPNLRSMFKWGLNYHFPICYPDAGFGGIVYFQRIRANLFFDNSMGKVAYNNGQRISTSFRSAGTEIYFDTKFWNQLPISFGIRYSHLLDPDLFGGTGSERFELVLPVNLFQR